MAVTFKGGTGATLVPPNSRLRVTWRWTLSGLANPLGTVGFNAVDIATKIRDALPSQGYIPASLPTAAPGDEIVVFNVRVGAQNPTRSLADHAALLDKIPVSSLLGGRIVDVAIVELTAIATMENGAIVLKSPTGGAAPTAAQDQAALGETRQTEQQKAQDNNLVNDAGKAIKNILDEIKDLLGALAPVLGIVVVAGIAYVVYKKHKG